MAVSNVKTVFLDLDGVVVNLVQGLCDFHKIENRYVYGEKADYDLSKVLDLKKEDVWKHTDEKFWENLPTYPWFSELMAFLEARFGQKNICLLTSPSGSHGCEAGKIAWIKKNLPAYSKDAYLIGVGKDYCAHPESLLIDDNDKNVDHFKAAGGQVFLFAGPWNSKFHITTPFEDLVANL